MIADDEDLPNIEAKGANLLEVEVVVEIVLLELELVEPEAEEEEEEEEVEAWGLLKIEASFGFLTAEVVVVVAGLLTTLLRGFALLDDILVRYTTTKLWNFIEKRAFKKKKRKNNKEQQLKSLFKPYTADSCVLRLNTQLLNQVEDSCLDL